MKAIHRWALLFLVVGSALQAAPLADPVIQLLPNPPTPSFVFDVPEGGPDPGLQKLTIKNDGTGQLNWSASLGNYQPANVSGWLTLSKTSGTLGPQKTVDVELLVSVGSIPAGIYNVTITVTETVLLNVTPRTASVQMRVSAVPRMSATPTSFTFAAPENGANPLPQPLTITNTGGGTLNWTAVVNQSWLKVDSLNTVNGSLGPAGSHNIQVSVITGSM